MAGGFDGSLKFDTGINTDGFEKDYSTLEKAMSRLTDSIDRLSENIERGFANAGVAAVNTAKDVDTIGKSAESAEQKAKRLKEQIESIPIQHFEDYAATGIKENDTPVVTTTSAESMNYDPKAMAAIFGEAAAEIHNYQEAVGMFGENAAAELNKEADAAENAKESTEEITAVNPDSLTGRIQRLNAELEEMSARGLSFGDTDFDNKYIELEQAKSELSDYKKNLTSAEVKTNKFKNTVKAAFAAAGKSTEKFGKQVSKSSKPGLMTILKYSLGIRSLYMLFNKFRTFVVDGFKNLSQYSKSTNKDLSAFKSSLTQMKNALAVAFAPIVSVATPYLTALINLLSRAANAVGRFFAALTGKKMATQAIKAQEDYAASLKKTGKEADKTRSKLASFDELEVLNKDDTASAGGGGEVNPSQMFEEVPINEKLLTYVDMLTSKLGPLKEAFSGLSGHIGDGLYWFRINVLEPLGNWTMNKLLPVFLDILTTSITILNDIITAFKPAWDYFWNEFLKPIAVWTGEAIINGLTWLNEKLTEFSTWITEHQEEVTQFITILLLFGGIALGVLATVKAMSLLAAGAKILAGALFSPLGIIAALTAIVVWAGNGQEMIENLKLVFNGFLKFISGVFAGDWEKAWGGIKDIFKGVFNGIIIILESAVRFIAAGLNKISFDIPEWVPGIGGRHFGFSIPEVHLPRLATGTVVPPRAGEFAAILGDNKRETEVVSPLSTIEEALENVLSRTGGSGGNIVIEASGDLAQFIKLIRFELKKEDKRVGVNLIKGAPA